MDHLVHLLSFEIMLFDDLVILPALPTYAIDLKCLALMSGEGCSIAEGTDAFLRRDHQIKDLSVDGAR